MVIINNCDSFLHSPKLLIILKNVNLKDISNYVECDKLSVGGADIRFNRVRFLKIAVLNCLMNSNWHG